MVVVGEAEAKQVAFEPYPTQKCLPILITEKKRVVVMRLQR